jgi:hypothetical protein
MAACSTLSIQRADVRASAAFYDAVLAVGVLTERGVQGDRLAAQVREQPPLHPGQRADGLGHVRRDPDGAGLVGHSGTGHRHGLQARNLHR